MGLDWTPQLKVVLIGLASSSSSICSRQNLESAISIALFGRFWHAATPFQGLATGEPSRGSFFLCYLTGFPVSFILIYTYL
jgi:hypothetical protein